MHDNPNHYDKQVSLCATWQSILVIIEALTASQEAQSQTVTEFECHVPISAAVMIFTGKRGNKSRQKCTISIKNN